MRDWKMAEKMTETPVLTIEAYRLINEEAAKKAYNAFAGRRNKRTTKEKMRDALAAYEWEKRNQRNE